MFDRVPGRVDRPRAAPMPSRTPPTMKAAILAAGPAPQLQPHTDHLPKTLVPVGGVPMLRRAMTSLVRCGIDQFVIATGHLGHLIPEAVASWFEPGDVEVAYVDNPDYHTTHNAASLRLLRQHLEHHPFFLLDGDVVFDVGVVEALLARGPDSIAIRSVGSIGLEEVKVTADRDDRILAIGKHVPIRGAMGESIGLALLSIDSARRLFAVLERRIVEQGLVGEYYEAAVQEMIDQGATLYGVDIGSLYATEIDTVDDLRAASERVSQPGFDVGAAGRLVVH